MKRFIAWLRLQRAKWGYICREPYPEDAKNAREYLNYCQEQYDKTKKDKSDKDEYSYQIK